MSDTAERDFWLSVRSSDGSDQKVQITGPGGQVRISVGRHGRHGTVWRIWSNSTKGDVYVASRTVAGYQKFSLHESGDWRYAWVNGRQPQPPRADRVLDRWERPVADQVGWTPGVSLWLPSSDIEDLPNDETDKKVLHVSEPEKGCATGIHVMVARPDQGEFAFGDGAYPVAAYKLVTGEAVIVVHSVHRLNDDELSQIERHRMAGTALFRESGVVFTDHTPGRRMAVFLPTDTGHRVVWDLIAPWG